MEIEKEFPLSLSLIPLPRSTETVRRHARGLQEEYRLIYRKLELTLYGPCK